LSDDTAESLLEDNGEYMKRTVLILTLGLLALTVVGLVTVRSSPRRQELSQAQFVALVQNSLVAKVRVYVPAKLGKVDGVPVMVTEVRGTYYQADSAGQMLEAGAKPTETGFSARVNLTPELEGKLLARSNVSIVELNPLGRKAMEWFGRSK
jgi:hypothetical protein